MASPRSCIFVMRVIKITTWVAALIRDVKQITYVIDEHIRDCESENIPVEKSYKGSFNLRLTPDLHRRLLSLQKRREVRLMLL